MNGNSGRNADGTFGPGNSGKPKGTRHRATQAVMALLDGEAEVLRGVRSRWRLGGDGTALRLCLQRIAPPRKDTPLSFTLPPMRSARDAAGAAAAVLAAVADGEFTPIEGAHVMGLIETYRRTLETSELECRVVALEGHRERAG
jgi:hypothetical protein